MEYFRRKGVECITEAFGEIAEISVADCFEMANLLCREFRAGKYGHIELCYTGFVSMLPRFRPLMSMLPLTDLTVQEKKGKIENLIL